MLGMGTLRAKQFEVAMGTDGKAAEYLRDGDGSLVKTQDGTFIKTKKELAARAPNARLLEFLGEQYLDQTKKFDANVLTKGGNDQADGFIFVDDNGNVVGTATPAPRAKETDA